MEIVGVLPGEARLATVTAEGGKICRIDFDGNPTDQTRVLCPGFIDIQVNGFRGIAFNDPQLTSQQVRAVTERLWREGVTSYCPTLTTDSFENLSRAMASIALACKQGYDDGSIVGIHLEGPYLSPEDGPRGAHPISQIRPPDWEEFQRLQDAAQGSEPADDDCGSNGVS